MQALSLNPVSPKTKQNKIKQNKTKQNITKQNKNNKKTPKTIFTELLNLEASQL
jgi:hypothetical protein